MDAREGAVTSPARVALPRGVRFLGWAVGSVLFLAGVSGLMLPVLQGLLTLALSAAILSFVSPSAHRALRWAMRWWPRGWRRILRWRRRLQRSLGV